MNKDEMFKKHFSHVEIIAEKDGITVQIVWKAVERANGYAWSVGQNMNLALRLKKAIESNIFKSIKIEIDRNGKTMIDAPIDIIGRRMNADLNRSGF